LNRPFDEPSQFRVRAESAAVLEILQGVAMGEYGMISSAILDWEVSKNPHPHKQFEIQKILSLATTYIDQGVTITTRARALCALGFRSYDALHLASAEESAANCFLTTDDKLLKLAAKHSVDIKVPVMNPVQWIWNQMT
jgi:hypothetical protein